MFLLKALLAWSPVAFGVGVICGTLADARRVLRGVWRRARASMAIAWAAVSVLLLRPLSRWPPIFCSFSAICCSASGVPC